MRSGNGVERCSRADWRTEMVGVDIVTD
jgi:hypothetical protein